MAIAAPRRRADGDEDRLRTAHGRKIVGKGQPVLPHIGHHQRQGPARRSASCRPSAPRSSRHPCRCSRPCARSPQNRRPKRGPHNPSQPSRSAFSAPKASPTPRGGLRPKRCQCHFHDREATKPKHPNDEPGATDSAPRISLPPSLCHILGNDRQAWRWAAITGSHYEKAA